jgi:hypothetical protein
MGGPGRGHDRELNAVRIAGLGQIFLDFSGSLLGAL